MSERDKFKKIICKVTVSFNKNNKQLNAALPKKQLKEILKGRTPTKMKFQILGVDY